MEKHKFRLGIWGWWQGHNLGDNWIKNILRKTFPFAEFVTTDVQDFSKYDFMICGGGGLFIYDVIAPWDKIENIKIPYGILGLGAEFPHSSNLAKKIEEAAKFFFIRDEYSMKCMGTSRNSKSYDCTFITPLHWNEVQEMNSDKVFFVWRDGQELLNNPSFREYIQYKNGVKEEWNSSIEKHFAKTIYDDFQTNEADIEARIGDAGFVISGRYHGIVAAIQKGIPFIAIDICPKIRALVEECGLADYCIKISEIDKVEPLILKAKAQIEEIRIKEQEYRTRAHAKMQKDVNTAYREIYKQCKPLKAIHYGSYWMRENDIINVMADDLANLCELKKIDLKIYDSKPDRRVKTILKEPNTVITLLDHAKIVRDVLRYKPNFVVLNSGGLVFEDKTFEFLKNHHVKTVGLELSDPDVFPYNGAIYAHKFDYFYTNSKYSLENQYDRTKVSINLMPFAASVKHHYYMPDVERKYDIVIVGHARPDRLEIVDKLSEKYKVGTYGNGWKHSLGVVNGLEHVRAINTGKIYLSFSKTMAGYNNVKVGLFEAMACKQVVVTEYMEELADYFEIGEEVLCYNSMDELYGILDYYLTHADALERVREKAYKRFLEEHTYESRWVSIIKEIQVD